MKEFFIGFKSLIFAAGFIFVWGWIALGISRAFDKYFWVNLPEWSKAIGIILMVIGGIIGSICVGTFVVRGQGTQAPFDPPKNFVATGLYRYVRNPMYIGGLIVLIGFGFYQNSVSILLFSILWILFANIFVAYYEEPTLRKRFGITYEKYCRVVHRWIPGRVSKM